MPLTSAARCSSVPVALGPSGIQSDTCQTTRSNCPIELQWSTSLPSVCPPAGSTAQTCWKRSGDVGGVEAVVRNGVVSPRRQGMGFASAMSQPVVGCYLLDLSTAHQPHAALVGGEG